MTVRREPQRLRRGWGECATTAATSSAESRSATARSERFRVDPALGDRACCSSWRARTPSGVRHFAATRRARRPRTPTRTGPAGRLITGRLPPRRARNAVRGHEVVVEMTAAGVMRVLVLGGGPAGVTAALQAAELGAEVTPRRAAAGGRHGPQQRAGAGAHAGPGRAPRAGLELVGDVRSARAEAGGGPRRDPGQRGARGPLRVRAEAHRRPHPRHGRRPRRGGRRRALPRRQHRRDGGWPDLERRPGRSSPSAGGPRGCRSRAPSWP